MASAADYLPPALSSEKLGQLMQSLDLPEPASITPLAVTAEYHAIYLIDFAPDAGPRLAPAHSHSPDGTISLVLRVSGRHLPHVKTLNEVAIMMWVREHTTIPMPAIVRYDASENNPIEHEFTLLERIPGESVDKLYDSLDPAAKAGLVEQLTDFVVQLHSHTWSHVGGLEVGDAGRIVPGRVLEETFWQAPDIAKYWPAGETVESLNIAGPYPSYVTYAVAHLRKYEHAIASHEALASMRDLLPRIDALISALAEHADDLNRTRYVLAHKDLHFANVMCDPLTGRITGILDWEFSGVVPYPLWNPANAFLWNGQKTAAAKEEQQRTKLLFENACASRGVSVTADAEPSHLQRCMQVAVNNLRAIVEVVPRGRQLDQVSNWRAAAEAAMEAFDV